jgi:hypothetical protein
MYSPLIHRRIEYLSSIITRLKECTENIEVAGDPSLIMELEEERQGIAVEMVDAGQHCITLLEAYLDDCKTENIPVFLDYWRVYKALKVSSSMS